MKKRKAGRCDGCTHWRQYVLAPEYGRSLRQQAESAEKKEGGQVTALDFLDDLEDMARQHCFTDPHGKHNGVIEENITDSEAISANASALLTLAAHGRFRVVRQVGRMVVGYWPEHDPSKGAK